MWIRGFITIFVAFVWWRLLFNFRSHRTTLGPTIVWFILWLSILAVFWSPEIASRLASAAGIGRGADLILYVSVIVLVYLAYRTYARIEKIERDITAVTRELALYEGRKQDHRTDPDR
ncbi:MAG: DUF2304 domain-containing protein [Candidatus Komeilibacteria bacterium]|nr:DUF2304 domain-containing protein [Candidatus Komeilibacteria bacterium]